MTATGPLRLGAVPDGVNVFQGLGEVSRRQTLSSASVPTRTRRVPRKGYGRPQPPKKLYSLGFAETTVPPGAGPVAHAHGDEDEAFYLLSPGLVRECRVLG